MGYYSDEREGEEGVGGDEEEEKKKRKILSFETIWMDLAGYCAKSSKLILFLTHLLYFPLSSLV